MNTDTDTNTNMYTDSTANAGHSSNAPTKVNANARTGSNATTNTNPLATADTGSNATTSSSSNERTHDRSRSNASPSSSSNGRTHDRSRSNASPSSSSNGRSHDCTRSTTTSSESSNARTHGRSRSSPESTTDDGLNHNTPANHTHAHPYRAAAHQLKRHQKRTRSPAARHHDARINEDETDVAIACPSSVKSRVHPLMSTYLNASATRLDALGLTTKDWREADHCVIPAGGLFQHIFHHLSPSNIPAHLISDEATAEREQMRRLEASVTPSQLATLTSRHRLNRSDRDRLAEAMTDDERTRRGLRFADEPTTNTLPDPSLHPLPETDWRLNNILLDGWFTMDALTLELFIDGVTNGFNACYNGERTATEPPSIINNINHLSARQHVPETVQLLELEQQKGKLRFTRESMLPDAILTPIGIREKEGTDSYRLITDQTASGVNCNTDKLSCNFTKFDGFVKLFSAAQPCGYGFGLDKQAAFQSLPRRPADFHLAVIYHAGIGGFAYSPYLPFGARISSPRFEAAAELYTTILLRRWNVRGIARWVDDFNVWQSGGSKAARLKLAVMIYVAVRIGFTLSVDKIQQPTDITTFIGINWRISDHSMFFPPHKVDKYADKMARYAELTSWSSSQLASITGTLTHVSRLLRACRPHVSLMYRAMKAFDKQKASKKTRYKPKAVALKVLELCHTALLSSDAIYRPRAPFNIATHTVNGHVTFTSDAVNKEGFGFGFFSDTHNTYSAHVWTERERRLNCVPHHKEPGIFATSTAVTEGKAIAYLLMTHADLVRHQHVLVYNDNTALVTAFNNPVTKPSKSLHLQALLHTFIILQASLDCALHLRHRPAKSDEGIRADLLSRDDIKSFLKRSPHNLQRKQISTERIPRLSTDVTIF
jgi:hypothetical protein